MDHQQRCNCTGLALATANLVRSQSSALAVFHSTKNGRQETADATLTQATATLARRTVRSWTSLGRQTARYRSTMTSTSVQTLVMCRDALDSTTAENSSQSTSLQAKNCWNRTANRYSESTTAKDCNSQLVDLFFLSLLCLRTTSVSRFAIVPSKHSATRKYPYVSVMLQQWNMGEGITSVWHTVAALNQHQPGKRTTVVFDFDVWWGVLPIPSYWAIPIYHKSAEIWTI